MVIYSDTVKIIPNKGITTIIDTDTEIINVIHFNVAFKNFWFVLFVLVFFEEKWTTRQLGFKVSESLCYVERVSATALYRLA